MEKADKKARGFGNRSERVIGPCILRWTFGATFFVCVLISLFETPYGRTFFSDHYSHMNAARLFPRIGLDLWRVPIARMFPVEGAERQAGLPADVRAGGESREVPGWPMDKPFVGGWTHVPRPYPPGDLLVVAPVALAYHYTTLSFAAACHLLILGFVCLAHIAFLLALAGAPPRPRAAYVAMTITAYIYTMYWSLRGFYDAIAMVALLACALSLRARRWLETCLAFVLAFFFHYRALFYAPWALFAALQIIREREWASWKCREWLTLALSAAIAAISLYTFVLVMPTLGQFPLENPIHPGHLRTTAASAFVAATAVAGLVFARFESYLDLTVLAWIGTILIATRQVQAWHTLLLLPWIFAWASSERVRIARFAFVATVTLAVFL